MLHYCSVENIEIYFRGFLMWGTLMSDQHGRSRCTLSDGMHNNNKTGNKKASSKNSTRNATIHLVTKCQSLPGTTKRLPVDGENLG